MGDPTPGERARIWRSDFFGDGSQFEGPTLTVPIDEIEFGVAFQINGAVLAERERCAKGQEFREEQVWMQGYSFGKDSLLKGYLEHDGIVRERMKAELAGMRQEVAGIGDPSPG